MPTLQIVTTPDGRALEYDGGQALLPALPVDAVVHAYATPSGLWVGVQEPGRPRPVYPGSGGKRVGTIELPADPSAALAQAKARRAADMDRARDTALAAGLPYAFADGDDVVQTRPQDQINLMGLANKAQRQLADGDDAPMPFRALSNQTRMLTPAETDAMALAALAHIEGIYARTWQAKDAVASAETFEALDAIEW